jgi:uncharacterized protein (DUF736 family)
MSPKQETKDRDNSGVLFRNDRKTEEKHPDYTGTVTIMTEKWRLAGWIKKSKAGRSYLSLSVQPDNRPEQAPKAATSTEVDF